VRGGGKADREARNEHFPPVDASPPTQAAAIVLESIHRLLLRQRFTYAKLLRRQVCNRTFTPAS
jgi:hypothetical protein